MTKKLLLGIFVILNLVLRSQTSVDYLTGTANVSFPIYSLTGRTMDFPVTLTYNSSSPKVNDIASWVGLGWTLNAGGAVTREVHGLPDEVRSISGNGYSWCEMCGGYLKANDFLVENGFIGPYVPGSTPTYSGGNLPQDIVHSPAEQDILGDNIKALISSGKLDLEPDLFQVNAPGLSLKFMFTVDDDKYPAPENGFFYKKKIVNGITYDMDSVVTFPKQDIIVEYTRTENEITSFIITNLDGTIYKFEQKQYIQGAFRRENDIERDGISYVMAWMLTSVTNANGQEEAHFTYIENENYSSHRYLEESRIAFVDGQYSYTDTPTGSSTPVRQGVGFCEVCDPINRTLAISKMKLVRIDSIVTPNGSIAFTKVVQPRQDLPHDFALNDIQLLNADNEFLGRCEFKYDYFISSSAFPGFEEFEYPEDSKRLKLGSITFYDSANISIDEGTQFSYDESGLPIRNSYAQDHWGYFNYQNNKSLACEYNFDHPYNRCGPNRESGYNQVSTSGTGKPCLLTKIDFQDGGSQFFDYEPNKFSKVENENLPLTYNVSEELIANVNQMLSASCYEDYTFETASVNFSINWEQDAYIEFISNETGNADITCSEPPNDSFLNRWITIEHSSGEIVYHRLLSCSDDEYSGRELVHLEAGNYSIKINVHCSGLYNHNTLLNVYLHYLNTPLEGSEIITRVGGGQRIRSIITSDGDSDMSNNMVIRVEYPNYLNNELSSGVLISKPSYQSFNRDQVLRNTGLGYLTTGGGVNITLTSDCQFDCKYQFTSSSSVEPLQTENGSFIVYTYVKVFNDLSGQASGYTDYLYDLDDIPENTDLISGMNFSRSWRNNALRRSSTYNSNGDLLATVIYDYEELEQQAVHGVQVRVVGETGLELAIATGVDHDALRKIQRKAVKDMLKATFSFAMTWGQGLGMTMAAVNFGMSVFQWINAAVISANNEQNTYQHLISQTVQDYHTTIYSNVTEVFELRSVSFKEYDPSDPTEFLAKKQLYEEYHHHALPSNYSQLNVNVPAPYGRVMTRIKYSDEYVIPSGASESSEPMIRALAAMKARNMKSIPIETVYYIFTEEGIRQVIGGELRTYRLIGDLIVPASVYSLEINEMPYSDEYFTDSYILNVNVFQFEKPYRKVVDYGRWDQLGNPMTVTPVHGVPMSVICSYPNGRPIASVHNAKAADIAYTSFEMHSEGGFIYDETYVQDANSDWLGFTLPDAKTGHRYMSLTSNVVSRNFDSGEYILSFWKKLGSVEVTSSESVSIEGVIFEDADERGWEYVEYKVSHDQSNYQTLTLVSSGGECLIDELRFYPVDAVMSTVCYNFDGTIQSSCDENNYCSYTGYDASGKPIWTMDQHYNVRATLEKVLVDEGHNPVNTRPKFISRIMLNDQTNFEHSMSGNLNAWDLITTQFFYDGLGRITQTQGLKQSPSGKDIIAQNFFDRYGRSVRQYLPFVRNFEGQQYIENFIDEQLSFYQNQPDIKHTDYPFSDIVFDDTPRNRVIEGGAVGDDWQIGNGHTVKQEIAFNEPNEVLFFRVKSDIDINSVVANFLDRIVTAMDNSELLKYWPEDKLKKVKVTDENGKVAWQYYDPFDRLILKRNIVNGFMIDGMINTGDFTNGMGIETGAPVNRVDYFIDTYFVYDNYGRLRFEIPHSLLQALIGTGNVSFGEADGMVNYDLFYNLGYGYKYDHRGNMIRKHSPEVPDFYVVYDEQNRPVMTQDAKQRQTFAWNFIRYDQLSRPAYRGILQTSSSREFIQKWYYDDPIWFNGNDDEENYDFAERRSDASGSILGYTHLNAPYFLNTINESNVHKVYYYDDYEFDVGYLSYTGTTALGSRIRGALTGELTKVLGTPDHFLLDCTYYDSDMRPVEICSSNILDGYDRYSNEFDWRGVLLKTTHEHLPESSSAPILIVEEFNRDRMGRLLNQYQKTGDDKKVMLAGYEYNELGQVRRKHIHIPYGMNTGMQTIDYAYNERGWLHKINNSGLVDDGVNLEDYDVFGMQLNYTESDWSEEVNRYAGSPLVPHAMYNGNLASIIWNAKSPDASGIKMPEKTYVYRYDDMYRLTCGAFAEEAAGIQNYGLFVNEINYYLEKSNYDVNGNINKILRIHGPAEGMNGPFLMDKLELKYAMNSHRLTFIKDSGYLNASEDFVHFTGIPSETVQYDYDVLGNCVNDHNKKLEMDYNELGLVSTFTHYDNPEDPVNLTYDADGTLLKKEFGSHKIFYIQGSEYEMEDGQLQLKQIHTAEGIVRPKAETELNTTEYIYDYFLTDHLGNVRVIISEGNSTEESTVATMELNNVIAEESEFQYLPYSRDAISIGYPSTAETGDFVAALNLEVDHGPAHLSKVLTGDQIVVSVQSWFPDNEEPESPITLSGIVTNLAVNLASQGIGILDEGLITLTTDPTWQTSILNFLQNQPESFDYTHAQGYLVYVYFDASLTIDENYSGMIQVTSPDEIEELQTQLLTMPGDGFFYTYLTNFSDNLVTFDNLTIRHRQGTLRNIHEYYPYGLEYWRSGSKLYDRGDQYSEFHHREWEMDGIEMNRFAARWYDPTIARWHAPDPLEQMHSPYVALCNDPANYVDPDGRAGIHLSHCDKQAILGFAGVIAGGAAMVGIGQLLQGAPGMTQLFENLKGVFAIAVNIFNADQLYEGVSTFTNSSGAGNRVSDAFMDEINAEMRSHGRSGLDYYGPQENLTMGCGEGDPIKPRNQATWNQLTFGLCPNPPSWVASTFNVVDGFSVALTDTYEGIKYSLSWDGIKSNALVGLNMLASEKTFGLIPNYTARQAANRFYNFMAEIPNYSIEDWQFGIGYGFEKACEMLLTRRIGIGVSAGISSKVNTINLPKFGAAETSTEIIASNGIKITGFTGHGVNRAIGSVGRQGVSPSSILDALKNPLKINDVVTDQLGRQSQRYVGQFSGVVVNPQTGKIISVNPTSTSKAAKILKNN